MTWCAQLCSRNRVSAVGSAISICVQDHWALGVVDLKMSVYEYYDSALGQCGDETARKCMTPVATWLANTYPALKDRSVAHWRCYSCKCPLQTNNVDCGMFMLAAIECLVKGLPLEYSQRSMPQMRQELAKHILRTTL